MSNYEKHEVNMSGYLEKKGKKKMMSSWKTYWFVLKGRLLLYYRSKNEALSPCKGSIDLGPASTVKPLLGTSCVFQIETKANNIILKAKSRIEQEKWLQAILSALNQTPNTSGMLHFRYSSDDLVPKNRQEHKNTIFTRQNTMPVTLKIPKRQTFCGSMEALAQQQENMKKNYSSTSDVSNKNVYVESVYAKITKSEDNLSQLVINDLYSAVDQTKENIKNKSIEENNIQLKEMSTENLYARISRVSKNEEMIENDTYIRKNDGITKNEYYTTQPEIQTDDVILENDQYCTPRITIMETRQATYHEYTIPQSETDIYSVPNMDHNKNTISKMYEEINPYSICDIYPKNKQDTAMERIYDCPLENYGEMKEEGNVKKLLQKFSKQDKEREVPQLPKKRSFLRKFFRLGSRKKSSDTESESSDLENPESVMNKKMLGELQQLLKVKKDNLQVLLNTPEQSTSVEVNDRIYQEIAEIFPNLPRQNESERAIRESKKQQTREHVDTNTLKTLDEILDDLNDMTRQKQVNTSKVKQLIAKFNNAANINNVYVDEDEVVLREKKANGVADDCLYDAVITNKNSSDELNFLLQELAKVTNAPVLKPGVTSSLEVTTARDVEFGSVEKFKLRRNSDPDYDIPRPHSNLNIVNDNSKTDDTLVATRFFGPVLTCNESKVDNSTPLISMAPDSLDFTSTASTQISYNSHFYEKTYTSHLLKNHTEDDVFADSLEPSNETLNIL